MSRYFRSIVFSIALCMGSHTLAQAQLLAHWKFDEISGPTAFDSLGNFNGTLTGSASFVSGGISGNAVSLSRATGDLVNMGTGVPGFSGSDFTLVTWARTSDSVDNTFVASKHESGTTNGYITGINTTGGQYGALNKAFAYQGGAGIHTPVSTSNVNDSAWHQIVNIRQGGTAMIYVDGVLEDSRGAAGSAENNAPFLIGGLNANGVATNFYTGLVDDVQLYNRALTASEVDFLFRNPGISVVPAPGALMTALLGVVPGLPLLLRRRRTPSSIQAH